MTRPITSKLFKNKYVGKAIMTIAKPFLWLYYAVGAMFFVNRDEPTPPDFYNADLPDYMRIPMWWLRNFGHEFRAAVIGVAYKEFAIEHITGGEDDFTEGYHKHVIIYNDHRLPFWSYQKTFKSGMVFQAYLGWMKSGRFGVKFRFYKHSEEK